jgi:hypothetical protein
MSELLTAADIAGLTAIDESAMNEVIVITDVTLVPDGGGGTTTTTATRTTVGYVWSATGRESGADQVKAMGSHRVAIPKDIPITATAKITQQSTGKVYNVVYPFPLTGYSTSRIIGLEDA